jgi:hypothetical protein
VVGGALALPFSHGVGHFGDLLSGKPGFHKNGALGLVGMPILPRAAVLSSRSYTLRSPLTMVRPPLSQAVSVRGINPMHVVRQLGVPLVAALKLDLQAGTPRNLVTCLQDPLRLPLSYPSVFATPTCLTSPASLGFTAASPSRTAPLPTTSSTSVASSSASSSVSPAFSASVPVSSALDSASAGTQLGCTRRSTPALAYTYQSRVLAAPLGEVAKRWREASVASAGDLLRSGRLERDDLDEVASSMEWLVEAYRGCT